MTFIPILKIAEIEVGVLAKKKKKRERASHVYIGHM